jgi:hypothetical protein
MFIVVLFKNRIFRGDGTEEEKSCHGRIRDDVALVVCMCAHTFQGLSAFVRMATVGLSHGKVIRNTVLYAGEKESFC